VEKLRVKGWKDGKGVDDKMGMRGKETPFYNK
jgi:hypothetical protein